MKNLKTFKIITTVILIMLCMIGILMYSFFDKIKKMYAEFSSKPETPITGNVGIVSNQSPVAIIQQTGKYFLGKTIISLTNESIGNIYRLSKVPQGATYCIIHLIDCEVEYNQDGDFSNGSPTANAEIVLNSAQLISVINMKIVSAMMPNSKLYIEYYQ